ncbi:MAG: HAD-IB family phosphatase, partial [archaeon]|nr:HAD-IB family phosphatase [archaeon]
TEDEEGYRMFVNQQITESEFMRMDIKAWKTAKPDLCRKDLIKIFQTIPLIEGIQETVATLQANGMKCVIVSGGIDIAAQMIANEFGFDDCVADGLEMDSEGYLTGEGVKVVDLADKSVWVRNFQKKYGVSKEKTVSIGNSFTDIPMFENSGFSIAINADEYTEAAASAKIKTENMADILDLIMPSEN